MVIVTRRKTHCVTPMVQTKIELNILLINYYILNLTDGYNHCIAIEFESILSLNLNIIPGTKVCLLGSDIPVIKGCILMDGDNVKILGGQVEVLKTKWEASKEVIGNKITKLNRTSFPPVIRYTP